MNRIHKIVLVGHNNSGSYEIASHLIDSFPDAKFMIVETTGIYYKKSLAASIWKLLTESSIRFCSWRFIELMKFKSTSKGLKQLALTNNCDYFSTNDINSIEATKKISMFAPDILSSLYTMHIYKKPVLEIPKICSITAHPSKIPLYRGLEVFFWQLANDETESAVSIFELSPKVDIGTVYWRHDFIIKDGQTVEGLYNYITKLACDGLQAVISKLDTGVVNFVTPASESSYYPMPTRKAVRKFLAANKRFF